MVLHPDVLKRAQAAIDAAVGSDRIPEYDDLAKIPYIEALVKETLRWRPVFPLSKSQPISLHIADSQQVFLIDAYKCV